MSVFLIQQQQIELLSNHTCEKSIELYIVFVKTYSVISIQLFFFAEIRQAKSHRCDVILHAVFRKKQLYTTVFVKTLSKPGLSAIYKNLSSEKFSDKHLKILHLPIFSENLRNFQTTYFGAAGWTDFWKLSSEYFDRNTIRKLIEIFRNLRIWSEF